MGRPGSGSERIGSPGLLPAPVDPLTLHDGWAEITSPGGFTGGVTARNVLRHPPVRRNPLLADVLQAIGLVNRAGLGVDRIYEELLLLGKDLPRYDADESHVRLVLPTRTHAHFVRFVHEVRRGGGELGLDDLILLRGLTRRRSLGRWTAAELLQLPEGEAARPGSSRTASEATWLRGAEVAPPTIGWLPGTRVSSMQRVSDRRTPPADPPDPVPAQDWPARLNGPESDSNHEGNWVGCAYLFGPRSAACPSGRNRRIGSSVSGTKPNLS